MDKRLILIIMDGWGCGDGSHSDAIAHAHIPFVNELYKKYPHSKLLTDGEHVGLPDGQMGNSEVGHLNIGAGRIVYQDLVKINIAVREKTINKNPVLLDALQYAASPIHRFSPSPIQYETEKSRDIGRETEKAIHLMGLVSDGGIHSHIEHLKALCDIVKEQHCKNVFIHAFTDGRDTDPRSGMHFIKELKNHLASNNDVKIASIVGRYYVMDRDKRWERIKQAYNLLVHGVGEKTNDLLQTMQKSYDEGITDEFIKPIVKVDEKGEPLATIKEDDVVICFNFRTDRCREITQVLTQADILEHDMHTLPLHYVTMTNYDDSFKGVNVMFHKDSLTMTLGEVLAKSGKKQIRIAETEKYPHVTYFFSGGREEIFEHEKRIMIPSPKVATYDLKPEMSAEEVTNAIIKSLTKGEEMPDFVCLNFANADMVGHTGVYDAIVKAVETVDNCVKRVVETGIENGYSFIIIADHGNADFVINADGSPNTAHTTNPVPCILVEKDYKKIKNGKLSDIAPTILKIMNMDCPKEMTGEVLV